MCAFDNKRYILDDGISTLAYGHKDIPNRIEINKIDNPAREKVITEMEARRVGLLWKRSKAIATRLGYDPAERVEETDEEAIDAGKRMIGGVRTLLAQVPEISDKYNPHVRKTSKRRQPTKELSKSACSMKRVRLPSAYAEDEIPETLSSSRVCSGVEGQITIPMPAVQSTLENSENTTRKAHLAKNKHRRKGARHSKSNPFVISEAVEME